MMDTKAVFSKIGKEQLKNMECLELDSSKCYLVVLKSIPREHFQDTAQAISDVFDAQGINTIIVPEDFVDIYKLEKE